LPEKTERDILYPTLSDGVIRNMDVKDKFRELYDV